MDPYNNYTSSRVPPQPYIETLQSDTPSHAQFSPADNLDQQQQQHYAYMIDDGCSPISAIEPQYQQQHFYEQQHNPRIYNGHDNISNSNDTFSGVGGAHPTANTAATTVNSLAASSASSTFQESVLTPTVPPFSSSSSITVPAPAATTSTAAASTINSSHQSSSFMDSIFKKKHHRRRSSSVLGWDSDDDEIMDRTTVAPSEHPSTSTGSTQGRIISEKSAWLAKEHGKQGRVRTCLCVGVVVCFIALGAVLGFTFKEQWTHRDGIPIGSHPKNGQNGHLPPMSPNGDSLEQLHQTIESTFHVNTTIIPDPNLRKVFYGIDYTPRGSQEPDCRVNLGNVIEDIKILSQLTDRIRLYGMACRQTEDVMKALQYLNLPDMQVIITLWVDSNKASWEKQTKLFWNLIDNNLVMDASTSTGDMVHQQAARSADTITISKVASRIIGISVGNEVLFRNEDESKKKEHVPLETLESYIQEIRSGLRDRAASASSSPNAAYSALGQQLAQIPIFSSDLGRNAHQIVDKVDWVLSNIHPFFAYTDATKAADWAFANFRDETLKAARGKPAMISEVGWPSGPSSAALGPAVPSMENLQTFVNTWVCQANQRNIPYYYFEAFDEPWKNVFNPRESQWGLMTVDRKLKVTLPNC